MEDIRVINLYKKFDDKVIFSNFSCTFKSGENNIIMGRSGIGKTTLINILLGIEKSDKGRVTGIPAKTGAVFQEDRLCSGTVRDAVEMVLDRSMLKNIVAGKEEYIRKILKELRIEDLINENVNNLSGGERRRVAIARAIAYSPDIYVFDEAFKGLDEAMREIVLNYVKKETSSRTVILVTHDAKEAEFFNGIVVRI